MTFTREDRRDKILDQLVYELFCEQLPKPDKNRKDKSTVGLCKRAKFLKNPNNLKPFGEKPL